MQISDKRGNCDTRIRHQDLDLLHIQYPSCVISGRYERSDRGFPREWPRDFKRWRRVFATEKSKCWINPLWNFRLLTIYIVGEGICKVLILCHDE